MMNYDEFGRACNEADSLVIHEGKAYVLYDSYWSNTLKDPIMGLMSDFAIKSPALDCFKAIPFDYSHHLFMESVGEESKATLM